MIDFTDFLADRESREPTTAEKAKESRPVRLIGQSLRDRLTLAAINTLFAELEQCIGEGGLVIEGEGHWTPTPEEYAKALKSVFNSMIMAHSDMRGKKMTDGAASRVVGQIMTKDEEGEDE